MIRVTIEMVPLGLGEPRHMATIEIANDVVTSMNSGLKRGSYNAKFSRISQTGQKLGWYDRGGRVENINRRTSGAVYRILHGVLSDFLKEQ